MMKSPRWYWIVALVVVAALSVAACGRQRSAPAAEAPAAEAPAAEAPAEEAAAEEAAAEDAAAEEAPTEEATSEEAVGPPGYSRALLAAFSPLPEVVTPTTYIMTDDIVDLGRLLYYEERISISQEMSCNTCHLLDKYGVDGLQFSLGHDGIPVGRNSPTVYNAALHIAQFWDGRSADVEAQAQGPILAAGEMGMPDPDYVVKVLKTIPGYVDFFQEAFPNEVDPINYSNVGKAIGAFERRLLTPGRWDALLNGDESALTDDEKAGLVTFVNAGCLSCHMGPAVGGMMFAKLGQVIEWPDLTDEGRFAVTGNEAERFWFKAPSLRNIAETGPYLHDGSIADLDEMVYLMGKHQLGKELTDAEVASIVTFLNALTGELPTEYIAVPEFPESGPDTPGPYEGMDN